MLRLVTVDKPARYLPPETARRSDIATYPFVVLKEDESDYLLEMPPGGGGHMSSSAIPAWWVSKDQCKHAYKTGQRWRHKDRLISELKHDNVSEVLVVQILSSVLWNTGETILEPSIESNVEAWTYLRGQESPQE